MITNDYLYTMNIPRRFPRDYVSGAERSEYPFRIYVLYCPVEKQIRYVGYTSGALYYRLHQHCSESRQYGERWLGPKGPWIKGLVALDLLPFIRCIAGFHEAKEAKAFEAEMIRHIGAKRLLHNRDKKTKYL